MPVDVEHVYQVPEKGPNNIITVSFCFFAKKIRTYSVKRARPETCIEHPRYSILNAPYTHFWPLGFDTPIAQKFRHGNFF
jgi:hypothetical protein